MKKKKFKRTGINIKKLLDFLNYMCYNKKVVEADLFSTLLDLLDFINRVSSLLQTAIFRGVAQLGRALRSGRRGRGFESRRLDQSRPRPAGNIIKADHWWSAFIFLYFHYDNLSYKRSYCAKITIASFTKNIPK